MISRKDLRWFAPVLLCITLFECTHVDQSGEQKATSELRELEEEIHQLVNQYRVSQQLPPLVTHEIITYYARMHSRAMARGEVAFGHHGFPERVEMISRFLTKNAAAENVACNNETYSDCARHAVQDWIGSSRHRQSINGDYVLTGVGVAASPSGFYYFTQIFWR